MSKGPIVIVKQTLGMVVSVLGMILASFFSMSASILAPWKKNAHDPSPDLPWNGPNSKPMAT
jgi:hypothetical protein